MMIELKNVEVKILVWEGVVRPYPPVCDDIVTPRNLFDQYHTVCFISTVTFHDGVAPKVIKIIQFCKKHLEDNTLTFCYQ